MTISTAGNRASYDGNGVTVAFSFPYRFLANADLVVLLVDTSDDSIETLVLDTDYTITGALASGGGTVTLSVAPPTLHKLIIYGNPAIKQLLDLIEYENMPAEEVERELDKLTLICARLSDQFNRSIKISDASTATFNPTLPVTPVPGATLALNEDGENIVYGPLVADLISAEAAAAASAAAAAASAGAAAASASSAATSASNSSTNATNAATSATNASNSATAAATSETNAATSASDAASSAADAAASAASVGGVVIYPTQSIAAGAQITLGAEKRQMLKVQGNGAARDANVLPFDIDPEEGTTITLVGKSDTNTLKISYNDNDGGCLIKGDCYLGLGSSLTLLWDDTDKRYYELGRTSF